MGKLFDEMAGKGNISPIKKYLKDRGFKDGYMNPRYIGEFGYRDLTLGKKCLIFQKELEDERYLRLYINKIDIYYEVETSYRSYDMSDRYDTKDYTTVEDISSLLDKIMNDIRR